MTKNRPEDGPDNDIVCDGKNSPLKRVDGSDFPVRQEWSKPLLRRSRVTSVTEGGANVGFDGGNGATTS